MPGVGSASVSWSAPMRRTGSGIPSVCAQQRAARFQTLDLQRWELLLLPVARRQPIALQRRRLTRTLMDIDPVREVAEPARDAVGGVVVLERARRCPDRAEMHERELEDRRAHLRPDALTLMRTTEPRSGRHLAPNSELGRRQLL